MKSMVHKFVGRESPRGYYDHTAVLLKHRDPSIEELRSLFMFYWDVSDIWSPDLT